MEYLYRNPADMSSIGSNGVNAPDLASAIQAESLGATLLTVTTINGGVDVILTFGSALSAPDKATVDGVVDAHSGKVESHDCVWMV